MPGAWELEQAKSQTLVAILTRETVTTAWSFGFKNLIIPGQYTGLSGMPFDHARNEGCKRLLELGWEWLFFLDDDVICPHDIILRLQAHRKPIVSGLYYRRNEPIVPVMLRKVEGEKSKHWITEFKIPDLMQVDYVGAGCLLIHKSVIEKVLYPWFDWHVDRMDLPEGQRTSEDFTFCDKAQEAGFPIFVDTSLQCKHCGLSENKMPGVIKPLVLM